MSNYFVNGVNLDTFYLPRETVKRPNVQYASASVDLSQRYESLKRSQRIPHTPYYSSSTNFSDLFMGNPIQYSVTNRLSNSRTSQWFNSLTYDVNVTFSSLSHYNEFFFYGGRIRISASHTNTSTSKNNSWNQLLSNAGVIEISEVETYRNDSILVSSVGATNVSSSLTTVYNLTSGLYTDNYYRIRIRRVSNTVLNIQVIFYDGISGTIDEPVAAATSCFVAERRHPTVGVPTYTVNQGLNSGS